MTNKFDLKQFIECSVLNPLSLSELCVIKNSIKNNKPIPTSSHLKGLFYSKGLIDFKGLFDNEVKILICDIIDGVISNKLGQEIDINKVKSNIDSLILLSPKIFNELAIFCAYDIKPNRKLKLTEYLLDYSIVDERYQIVEAVKRLYYKAIQDRLTSKKGDDPNV